MEHKNRRQFKLWGVNDEIFSTDSAIVNVLHINKGGTCSRHVHKYNQNLFHIISGQLRIKLIDPEGLGFAPQDELINLLPDVRYHILSGVEHQFQAVEDTVAIEIVYNKVHRGDIDRKEPGCNPKDERWKELI